MLTDLVGRQREIAAAVGILRGGQRLLTLTGPGGVGKTQLSLAIASAADDLFPDGTVFVSLAPIANPELVAGLVAAAFEVSVTEPVQVLQAVAARVGQRRMLVLIDNFEHVLGAAPLLTELLAECPALSVLATSRSPLRLSGEYVLPVSTLNLPNHAQGDRLEDLENYDAVQLFIRRARAACGEFSLTPQNAASVVEICRKLDGLPLAIELATARLRVLPPQALLERLQHGLPLLSGGAQDTPPRLRTMRDAIAWSYDLLAPAQQVLFRRLGVFAGGCSVDAVEAACADRLHNVTPLDDLSSLVDHSLIRRSSQTGVLTEPRFEMLQVVREFALDRLAAAGEEELAQRAHAQHFRLLAERAGEARGVEQERWLARMEEELNNVRAALAWSLSDARKPADLEAALELAGGLWFFWIHHSSAPGEARLWLTRALEVAPAGGSAARGKALLALGAIEWRQGDYDLAKLHLDQSVEIFGELGDSHGLANAFHLTAHVLLEGRAFSRARALFEASHEAHARAGDLIGGLPLVGDLGMVAYHEGDYETARRLFQACLRSCREHGVTDHAADSLNRLGDLARLAGDFVQAQALYSESLALWQSVRGRPGIASALHKLGQTARHRGDAAEARRLLAESLGLQREIGNKQGTVECLVALAGLALECGPPDKAVELLAASEAQLGGLGAPLAPADQADFERDLAMGKARLSAKAWAAAHQKGRSMGIPEAEALALALAVDNTADRPMESEGAAVTTTAASVLSPRETEVASLIAEGLTNREIAAGLVITEKTAANHVEHIMAKLNLRSRAQIAVWAVRHGFAPAE
ncbi:MAG TPA: tetratricopeptide repeat protein [Chloroflexota bacterium]|jgi:predicted ATPase/DNA-binding CsgD family transcriptional regulator|nr:tetratricopeptide repeat protein [Chloroflexota bacterium]